MTDTPKFQIKLGCKFTPKDSRDYKFSFPIVPIDLPPKVDLRHKIRQIFKQEFNDCVSQGTSNLISALDYDTKYLNYTPSRMYIYYNARAIDGSEYFDEETSIRNAMKSLSKNSFLSEESYKYIPQNVFMPPPLEVIQEAKQNKVYIQCYKNIDNTEYNLKYVLSQNNIIIFGAMLYESFTNLDKDYKCPDPDISNEKLLGGHCMLICGFSNKTNYFTVCNSWSSNWGDGEIYYMSYKYICSDLCADFWIVDNLNKST